MYLICKDHTSNAYIFWSTKHFGAIIIGDEILSRELSNDRSYAQFRCKTWEICSFEAEQFAQSERSGRSGSWSWRSTTRSGRSKICTPAPHRKSKIKKQILSSRFGAGAPTFCTPAPGPGAGTPPPARPLLYALLDFLRSFLSNLLRAINRFFAHFRGGISYFSSF